MENGELGSLNKIVAGMGEVARGAKARQDGFGLHGQGSSHPGAARRETQIRKRRKEKHEQEGKAFSDSQMRSGTSDATE